MHSCCCEKFKVEIQTGERKGISAPEGAHPTAHDYGAESSRKPENQFVVPTPCVQAFNSAEEKLKQDRAKIQSSQPK
ncbi:unnamed protein product [Angiostrongylus costaricensis]|uniref:Testis expressed metallothionein like protein n=1 Tax=Angiostrongylus costaricensis TaxID=334426 RepID=A0A0R3Q1X3_ANGCS|nr:unnamed protein product [Angiostrongylus costaricensis]